jgi:multidrug efflux system membrane fusion protein
VSPRPQAVLAAVLIIACAGCGAQPAAAKGAGGAPPAPVTVATAVAKDVPRELRAIGAMRPSSTVTIRSQVTGLLTAAGFAEGGEVKQGQPLFTIDPRPLEQAVKQAEANVERSRAAESQAEAALVRDQAQAENAVHEAERYAGLQSQGITTKEQVEQLRAAADAARATLDADRAAIATAKAETAADQAAVDTARVQLGYCAIASPIDGRVGVLGVNVGNLVTANTTELVTINRLRPIYATFSVPEGALTELRERQAQGAIPVAATPASGSARADGALDVIDNQVTEATGTIALRATFANADAALWPGQFVDLTVTLGTDRGAITVPSQAVQTGQKGDYVYVVKGDDTAEARPVAVARIAGADAVIAKGLDAGERVVTDGMVRVANGVKVRVAEPGDGAKRAEGGGVAKDGHGEHADAKQ